MISTLLALLLCKQLKDITRWTGLVLMTCGVFSFGAGVAAYIYKSYMLPGAVDAFTSAFHTTGGVLTSYLQDCIAPTALFMLVTGIFSICFSSAVILMPRLIPSLYRKGSAELDICDAKSRELVKGAVYLLLIAVALSAVFYRLDSFRKDFEANDFNAVIAKMRNTGTQTRIIPARGETIYLFQVKIRDSKTGKPAAGVHLDVSGKSEPSGKGISCTGITDDTGSAKFFLDKGSFRLKVLPLDFPPEYKIPEPYDFDLKTSGITITTLNLENLLDAAAKRNGFAEIEVLDRDNNPVPNLPLKIDAPVVRPDCPDNMYSYTNADGIAVFKVGEGSYKVSFAEASFPARFVLPFPFDINVVASETSRYTIRLSDAADKSRKSKPSGSLR